MEGLVRVIALRRPKNSNKIVHFSSVHRADDTRIMEKECRTLADSSFDVTLIARADIDYVRHGVRVRAFERPRGGNKLTRILRTSISMLKLTLGERAEAYHFHDPELLHIGVILRILGRKVVYDSHETTSKQFRSATWIPKPLRGVASTAIGWYEKLASTFFTGIVAATPAIARGFPAGKVVIAQNFPRLDGPLDGEAPVAYKSRDEIIAYVGSINPIRGLFQMITAMDHLPRRSRAELHVGGEFPTKKMLDDAQDTRGWNRVHQLGWLDRSAMAELLHKSRIGLLPVHPVPNYLDGYPVKLFEYMLAGIPVVSSDIPFWRQFVDEPRTGIMVDPFDPQAMADAIQWLLDNRDEAEAMGHRGRQLVREKYAWEREGERLIEFYRNKVLE